MNANNPINQEVFLQSLQDFFHHQGIEKNDTIILGCSGGADSMCLLFGLGQIWDKTKLYVAHFNHSIRGEESKNDAQFVKQYCQENNYIFVSKKVDIVAKTKQQNANLEEIARQERYNFFTELQEKTNAIAILTAHHLDDRIETAFFHLLRGTKIKGLSYPRARNNYIFRPLLSWSKTELLDIALQENIPFRHDSTNDDTTYTRNYLRKEILPLCETINPSYRKALKNFLDHATEISDFLEEQSLAFLGEKNWFFLSDFFALAPLLQKEIIRKIYEQHNNWTAGLSEENMKDIFRFLHDSGNPRKKQLKKLLLRKESGIIFIISS